MNEIHVTNPDPEGVARALRNAGGIRFPGVAGPRHVPYGDNGAVRESQEGKPRFELLLPLGVPLEDQFLTRIARHMTASLQKYPERNWELFETQEALDRCMASAFRHFMAWQAGETDEDHAAAVAFNLIAAEHVRGKLEGKHK